MRQGQQHRRGRGRNNNNNNNNNNRRGHNPLARSFESNGPDVKVRGTPADIAAKYLTLARDAQSSGDPVLAENYFQHAEHYNRIIMAYREQQVQQQGQDGMNGNPQRFRQDGQPFNEGASEEFSEEESSEDLGLGEQPTLGRGPGDAPRPMEGRAPEQGQQRQHEPRQHDDGGRQHRQHDQQHQQRFNRNDRGDRYNRHDRGERQDRGDRFDRGDRDHRNGSGRGGYDRPQSDSFGNERSHADRGDRGGYTDRQERAERPADRYQPERSAERHQDRQMMERPPVERASEDMEARAPRPRPAMDEQQNQMPEAAIPAPARAERAEKPEGAPRRRERYSIGSDQPDFLRRPVRRPRREAAEAPSEPPATATDEPTGRE